MKNAHYLRNTGVYNNQIYCSVIICSCLVITFFYSIFLHVNIVLPAIDNVHASLTLLLLLPIIATIFISFILSLLEISSVRDKTSLQYIIVGANFILQVNFVKFS